MAEQYFNLEKLLENQRNLDNKFKEKMGFDKIVFEDDMIKYIDGNERDILILLNDLGYQTLILNNTDTNEQRDNSWKNCLKFHFF